MTVASKITAGHYETEWHTIVYGGSRYWQVREGRASINGDFGNIAYEFKTLRDAVRFVANVERRASTILDRSRRHGAA